MKEAVTRLLFHPLFWIAVLFAVRLENYPTSTRHQDYNWRSSYTSMVSRNMLEVSANPFYPRVDHSGQESGIAACEFPVFNGLQFFGYKIFGYAPWYGRFINLVVSSLGLWFFFCLARRLLKDDTLALAAMLFLATSIWFNFSRRNMPDTFAVSLGLMAVEAGWRFLEKGDWWRLAVFFALCAAGLLSKMPAACNLPLLVIPLFFDKKLLKSHKIALVAAGSVAVAMMAAWYFWWVPYLETIGMKLTWPEKLADGWRQIFGEFAPRTWRQFQITAFGGEFVFWLAVAGLVFLFFKKMPGGRRGDWPVLAAVGGWAVVSFFFMLKAGFVFSTHDYYTVPLVPVMALLAANAFSVFNFSGKKWLVLAVALAAGFVAARRQALWFNTTNPWDLALNRLESLVDKVVPPGERIIANDYRFSPVTIYWSHRRGEVLDDGDIRKPGWVAGKCDQGICWAVVPKILLRDSLPFEVALDDPDFRIYKLRKTGE